MNQTKRPTLMESLLLKLTSLYYLDSSGSGFRRINNVVLMLLAMTSFPPTSSAAARHAGKKGGGQKLVYFLICSQCSRDQRNSFVQDGKQTQQRVKRDAVATETGSTVASCCPLFQLRLGDRLV